MWTPLTVNGFREFDPFPRNDKANMVSLAFDVVFSLLDMVFLLKYPLNSFLNGLIDDFSDVSSFDQSGSPFLFSIFTVQTKKFSIHG